MTAKQQIVQFLDITSAYLRSGYKRRSVETAVAATVAVDTPASATPPQAAGGVNQAAPADIDAVAARIRACAACSLHAARCNAVPGEGVNAPLVLVIGDEPGENEDKIGKPFVGEAGQLLDKMLAAIGLARNENCFITNIVKCRTPHDRDPLPEEAAACATFLVEQIALLKPSVILCAGRVATQNILKTTNSIKNLHGHFIDCIGVPLLPTYHPNAILHDPSLKRPAWDDLKTLRARLNQEL
jgi:DNA polymerase